MSAFNIMALDASFNIVSLIRYTNLQWSRKWHEPGHFSVQIPVEQYRSNMLYIYTKDRPELGKISQINYVEQNGYKYMQLSGKFLENELNRRVVYPLPSNDGALTNIINGPSWTEQEGAAESVAFSFFDAFRDVDFNIINDADETKLMHSRLGIVAGVDQGRGNTAKHTRNGEYLGSKIYSILKPSGMSYRVAYDFLGNEKVFGCASGYDRTQEQTQNNPIVFSTKYGNIKNPNILIDNTNHKTASITKATGYVNSQENIYIASVYDTKGLTIGMPGEISQIGDSEFETYDDAFLWHESQIRADESFTGDANKQFLDESPYVLNDYTKIVNLEFDAMTGSYEYMEDFDIGDMCSIEVPEVTLSASARLIGCYEVIKSGKWELTMEFGTPILL